MGTRIGPFSHRQFEKICARGDIVTLEEHQQHISALLSSNVGKYLRETLLEHTFSNRWFLEKQIREKKQTHQWAIFKNHWLSCKGDRRPLLSVLSPSHAQMKPVELLHWLWSYPTDALNDPVPLRYRIFFTEDCPSEIPSDIATSFYLHARDQMPSYMPILVDGWQQSQPMLCTLLRHMHYWSNPLEFISKKTLVAALQYHPSDVITLFVLFQLAQSKSNSAIVPFRSCSHLFKLDAPLMTVLHSQFPGVLLSMDLMLPSIESLPIWREWDDVDNRATNTMPSIQVLIDTIHQHVLGFCQKIENPMSLDWYTYADGEDNNSP